MPESMDGSSWGRDTQPRTKPLHSAQLIPPSHVLPLKCGEHKVPFAERLPSPQMTPQLKRERNQPVLRALAVQLQKQIVKVHVRPSQCQSLAARALGHEGVLGKIPSASTSRFSGCPRLRTWAKSAALLSAWVLSMQPAPHLVFRPLVQCR